MARHIQTLTLGKEIKYFDKQYVVTDLYPSIAYLTESKEPNETICVCLGDLVIAGVEPSMVSYIPKYNGKKS